MAILGTLAAGLIASGQGEDKMAADQAATLSRGKQIAVGLLIYTSDYDDVLPWPQDSPSCWRAIDPYVKNREVFKTLNPNGGMFAFNMAVGGVSMTAIREPAETIMVYETQVWPDGRRLGANVDSSTRLFKPEAWAERAKSLKLKLKRTAKKPLPKDWLKSEARGG